jgi:HprK-related kinase A
MPPAAPRPDFGRSGLFVRVGPVTVFARSDVPMVDAVLSPLYARFPVWPPDANLFPDFRVDVVRPGGPRRWVAPQAVLEVEGSRPFTPAPAQHAPLLLEGGLNWMFIAQTNFFLVLHAAVIERNGVAVILPGPPGAGKSTLCSAAVLSGWRLFSDEFCLISLDTGRVHPLPRPISLKNQSIDIIRGLAPEAVFSPRFEDTPKGTIALLQPPDESVRRMEETALPRWVVMPRYVPDSPPVLEARAKVETFRELIQGSYNYHALGRLGFTLLADLVERADCYIFRYSNLPDALRYLERLVATGPTGEGADRREQERGLLTSGR